MCIYWFLIHQLVAAKTEWMGWVESCVAAVAEKAETGVMQTLALFSEETHKDIKCTPDFTLTYQTPVKTSLSPLVAACVTYRGGDTQRAGELIKTVVAAGQSVSAFLLYAKATSHSSPNIEVAESEYGLFPTIACFSCTVLKSFPSLRLNLSCFSFFFGVPTHPNLQMYSGSPFFIFLAEFRKISSFHSE